MWETPAEFEKLICMTLDPEQIYGQMRFLYHNNLYLYNITVTYTIDGKIIYCGM